MIARAMSTQPPAGTVFPLQLAKRNAHWSGELALSAFARLGGLLVAEGPVAVELEFEAIDRSSCRVVGSAAVDVVLECQACLEDVPRRVHATIDYRVVRSEAEAQEVATSADPFLMRGESVAVAELVEDDLLMSLPIRGCEAGSPCPNRPQLEYPADADAASGADDTGAAPGNPFAVLESLRRQQDD